MTSIKSILAAEAAKETRAQILYQLRLRGPMTSSEIAEITGLSVRAVARGIRLLRDAGEVYVQCEAWGKTPCRYAAGQGVTMTMRKKQPAPPPPVIHALRDPLALPAEFFRRTA